MGANQEDKGKHMPLQISFELSDKDLEHFRSVAETAQKAVTDGKIDGKTIAAEARKVFEESTQNKNLPEFISTRLAKLETLVDMVDDKEWQLPDDELTRVCGAMAYFAKPDDMIHDHIPGIGFLDDAIMVELMVENLQDDMDAYQEFCQFRTQESEKRAKNGLPTDIHKEDWLADQRAVLHHRMRTRRNRRTGRIW